MNPVRIPYIGNSAYCYSNSTSMLLASMGENISPSLVEVLSGVGVGAFILSPGNLPFFSGITGEPDRGVTQALKILGFEFNEKAVEKGPAPFDELKSLLENSPAVLGPLDMGYLTYDPDYNHHRGIDHYVLVYKLDNKGAHLHDPAGFPYVVIPLEDLEKAWRADAIGYKRGSYRYWTYPKRISNPSSEEIYKQALDYFKLLYKEAQEAEKTENKKVNKGAILFLAGRAKNNELSEGEKEHLINFALPLGAKRAIDYAIFFENHNVELSDLKNMQSILFGETYSFAVGGEWHATADTLAKLADVEEEFRIKIASN